MRSLRYICVVIGVLMLLPAQRALYAHGPTSDKIVAVTQLIKAAPFNASHYWHRGELYHRHRDFAAADVDFTRAIVLLPTESSIHLSRARMLVDWGKSSKALEAVDRFLVHQPNSPDGRLARSRALAGIGRSADAVLEIDRAIAASLTPKPDDYLERARLVASQNSAGDHELVEALRGLDEGIQKLGSVAALQIFAIELEERRGDFEAALQRIDELMKQYIRRETLLARRGDLLARAGRDLEASAAYTAALDAIDDLPGRFRDTNNTTKLRRELEQKLTSQTTQLETKQ